MRSPGTIDQIQALPERKTVYLTTSLTNGVLPMKRGIILVSIAAAVLSLLLGGIGRLFQTHFWLTNPTWHELAQTFLLLATAWGVYQLVAAEREK